ncbi:NAD(P)-binding protein [Serendipita vermifera]|nr:NAD(P)-binding protein [Serendipita vermifera]
MASRTLSDIELYDHSSVLKGKVVLITGAGSGIGRAAAIAFASHRAKIIIGDIDVAGGEQTIQECLRVGGANGADAMVLKCNVTSWEDQAALFAAGHEKYGRIDYVIPNAGIGRTRDGPLALTGLKEELIQPLTKVIDVNLTGVIYTVRLGQYYLMKTKSNNPKAIVFIGSMYSLTGLPRGEIYTATKHAVWGLARSLRDDFVQHNIRVATICPWFTETNILKTATKVILAGIPLTPIERVAGAIVNAATDPDWETSGATYSLPDQGEVLRIDRHELNLGSYKTLTARISLMRNGEGGIRHYRDVYLDLLTLTGPKPLIILFPGPLIFYYFVQQYLLK